MKGFRIPHVTFRVREGDETTPDGGCSFEEGCWVDKTTEDFFGGKRVVLFSLPGAFTPTCTSKQLPGFEFNAEKIKSMGIDEIYCCSVNDSFVMNAWSDSMKLENVKVIPDGNGEFTRKMGMLVEKNNLGFGYRSWRYATIIDNCKILESFVEPGFEDNCKDDPYEMSSPQNILKFLKEDAKVAV